MILLLLLLLDKETTRKKKILYSRQPTPTPQFPHDMN
jgi:hypothetical protein